MALFADAVGGEKAASDKYYRLALSERSALKRWLARKGTAGFSEDMPRTLANFLTSNARLAAQRLYMCGVDRTISSLLQQVMPLS